MFPHMHRLIAAGALALFCLAMAGCGGFGKATISQRSDTFDFRNAKVGVCVVLNPVEQQALEDRRIISRSVSSAPSEGYAGDYPVQDVTEDVGFIRPPKRVDAPDQELEHGDFYPALLSGLRDSTLAVLGRHGYSATPISVPLGEFEAKALIDSARDRGCDAVLVTTVELVRSWNVKREPSTPSAGRYASTFLWETQVGGLVLLNVSMLSTEDGSVVWEHARMEIEQSYIGPLVGELWDDGTMQESFGDNPGDYQGWLYRQSMPRAFAMAYGTAEPGFIPLPEGSDRVAESRRQRSYSAGDRVFVKPEPAADVWHLATVVDDAGTAVRVNWPRGMWEPFSETSEIPKGRVVPFSPEWREIVWVRSREELKYTPYRFVREERQSDIVHTILAGDLETRTYYVGRVGVVPF